MEAQMAAKKGLIPSHVQKKQFTHPCKDHPIIQALEGIEDVRKPSQFFRYSLTSVLFMALVTQICGAKDWPQTVVMCEGMSDWLKKYIDMSGGVPCERTFKNLFNLINPESMEKLLIQTADLVRERVSREVVSFDGQTERGTRDNANDIKGIHLLNAWSVDNEICLGQIKVDDKSNEITAMPLLMEVLDLKGTIITADALNTQKAIIEKAEEMGADYVFPVKGNQETLLQEITSAFEQLDKEQKKAEEQWEWATSKAKEHRDKDLLRKLEIRGPDTCGATFWESIEKGHGRIEMRNCTTLLANDLPVQSEWNGLKTIVRISRKRKEGTKIHEETIYYISSMGQEAELIANVVRSHWRIENSLHWRLDVIFGQDKSRYRDRNGARNLAICRKMALNLLQKETTLKRGMATKQAAAIANPAYREKVLKNLF
jgi:predicted transposase YbfD/YdcC